MDYAIHLDGITYGGTAVFVKNNTKHYKKVDQ